MRLVALHDLEARGVDDADGGVGLAAQGGQIAPVRSEGDRGQQAVVFGRYGAFCTAGNVPYEQTEPSACRQGAAVRTELKIVRCVRDVDGPTRSEILVQQQNGVVETDGKPVSMRRQRDYFASQRNFAYGLQLVCGPDAQWPFAVAAYHLTL